MLTRLVRIQLTIFAVASIVGVAMMIVVYMQVPTMLGIGRIKVTLELPGTGGLYRFSNVTYRGAEIGKVTAVTLTEHGANATLSLGASPRIPADLRAKVRSVSAIGEQYVDLQPRTKSGPFLRNGSVIRARDTEIPQPVGPMLDQVNALIKSIPKEKLSALLDESFKGLNGAGYDLGSLLDSSATVVGDLNQAADRARTLTEDSAPLLDAQAQTTDSLRTWAHSLAGITERVTTDDPQVRKILHAGPGALNEVSRLLEQVKPTLPVLLANLTTLGQVAVTYRPALEQLLVLLPPSVASIQSFGTAKNNPTGYPLGDFAVAIGDPIGCTVGFLPPSQWRSPADTSVIDTPDGLYCKLPQDAPTAVRGARNLPCMGKPGKRAPTVQICDSDKPYMPLAMRQHVLGPYPLDPNLLAQGIPPDDRVNGGDKIYAPVEGTPLPPGASPAGTPPGLPAPPGATTDGVPPTLLSPPANLPGPGTLPPPTDGAEGSVPSSAPAPEPPAAPSLLSPPSDGGAPSAAPSSFGTSGAPGPSVAVTKYNPRTGAYVTPDRQVLVQSDLVTQGAAKSWKDMFPT